MTALFIDASAAVSILTPEADANGLSDIAGDFDKLIWSAIAQWETAVAVARVRGVRIGDVAEHIDALRRRLSIDLVPIRDTETRLALDAFDRFGKGTGHPAQLNMGDCFAYACAKTNGARLLYKGDDFAHTDLA